MYLIDTNTQEVLTKDQVRQRNPNVSFGFNDSGLEGTPYKIIRTNDFPECDIRYQSVTITEPELINGQYHADHVLIPATDDFEQLLETKLAEINSACEAKICTSFLSSALGESHQYTSDRVDQMNIQGNVIDAMTGSDCYHICYGPTEQGYTERKLVLHTPEQMIQVGRDLKSHVWFNLVLANDLKEAAIAAAYEQDFPALIAVKWDNY